MIAIVLPVKDEFENLKILIPQLFSVFSGNNFVIIAVDGGSKDGSLELLQQFCGDPKFILLSQTEDGLGNALLLGFKQALKINAAKIVSMDADMSHDVKYIKMLIDHCLVNHVSIGSRYSIGGNFKAPKIRILLSKIGNHLISLLLGTYIADNTSGFRCYDANIFLQHPGVLEIKENNYNFQFSILSYFVSRGVVAIECPIQFIPRSYGNSKFTLKQVWYSISALFKIFIRSKINS